MKGYLCLCDLTCSYVLQYALVSVWLCGNGYMHVCAQVHFCVHTSLYVVHRVHTSLYVVHRVCTSLYVVHRVHTSLALY